ncbi:MAG: YlbF family regulator [Clostridia bacterium]|nr:YlbF family regulator [Clostridia bacterium]
MNDIIEKARELGQMIADSDEFKALKGAEELQLSDPEAQQLMMEYANTREALSKKAADPDMTKEGFEAIQTEMEQAFQKLMTNANIKRYIEANQSFKTLIDQVNAIIAYFVKGEEQSGSCSGNCSTCGGCK